MFLKDSAHSNGPQPLPRRSYITANIHPSPHMDLLASQTIAVAAERMTRPVRRIIVDTVVQIVLGSTADGMATRCRKEIDRGHEVMQPVLTTGDVDAPSEASWKQSLWQ
jgi:hypothetical protein